MRPSTLLVLLAAAFTLTGCAPRARLLVLRPAELDIAGIGRLAVVDFEGAGEAGKIARAALLTQLSQNQHYALVDQSELARVLPAAFVQGQPAEGAVVQAARQAGVDAILTGQVVSYDVNDDTQTDQHITFGSSEASSPSGSKASGLGIGYDINTLKSREASVSLAIKLIDARTGEIRAARQVSHAFQGRSLNGQGELPPREKILGDLLNLCARDVIALIAPHPYSIEVCLAKQYWGNGLAAVRRGNALAVQGDWTAAGNQWQDALKNNPRNHVALHNLAYAAAARGEFPAAIANVEKAVGIYADTDYHQTRKLLAEQQKLVDQAVAQARARPLLLPPNSLATSSARVSDPAARLTEGLLSPGAPGSPFPGDLRSPPVRGQETLAQPPANFLPSPAAGPIAPASFTQPLLPQRLPLPPE